MRRWRCSLTLKMLGELPEGDSGARQAAKEEMFRPWRLFVWVVVVVCVREREKGKKKKGEVGFFFIHLLVRRFLTRVRKMNSHWTSCCVILLPLGEALETTRTLLKSSLW